MSLILSIETATNVCSIALHDKGELLGLAESCEPNSHGKLIMGMVDKVLNDTRCKRGDLKAIGVSKGPGSYTGLRIGISTAKGLSFGLGLPLIGVDTLEGLAKQAATACKINDLIVPMIDARRMEVYTATYDKDLNIVRPLSPLVVEENVFESYLEKGKVIFLGDGVKKLREILKHSNSVFLDSQNSARTIGELAFKKFEKREFEDLAYFEPNYLKDFQVIKSKKNPLLQ